MEDLNFKTVKLPKPFLQMMANNFTLKRTTRTLLEAAFENGGYIAGGFANILARNQFGLLEPMPDEGELWNAVRMHLGAPKRLDADLGPFQNAGCGDIDVWFPHVKNLTAFTHSPKLLSLTGLQITPTVTNTAIEYLVDGDARVQVITQYVAPIVEQLSRFDIYNGMVAVTEDSLVFPEHLEMLERERMLHVVTWESKWTINRVFKWLHRKRYQSVTPAVADHIMRLVSKTLDWKASHIEDIQKLNPNDERLQRLDKLRRFILTSPKVIQTMLGPAMRHMTGEQLLELSTWFQEPLKYDLAMQEIHRRMPPK